MGENLAVLVTGSMRSGTSSLAGSLKMLGLHVPQPEVPASERNPKGHFEPHWVIKFHKRVLRAAVTRPSDGSPQAFSRVSKAVAEGGYREELRGWLEEQAEPRLVIKDPHSAWLLETWHGAAAEVGRDLRVLTALRHPAEVVGSQERTWGHRRDEAMRRVKETSNVAAWLNLALVTERTSRSAPRAFIRYDDLLADWRVALGRVSDQLDLGLDIEPAPEQSGPGHPLDEWLDPGLRRSALSFDDIEVPDWLREAAGEAWRQLGTLVDSPNDSNVSARMDEIGQEYHARYAEAVALTLDEARHRERLGSAAGAAKIRARLKAERQRRRTAEAALVDASPKRGLFRRGSS